jgi:hypothetical protein
MLPRASSRGRIFNRCCERSSVEPWRRPGKRKLSDGRLPGRPRIVAWVAHFIYLPLWWVGLVVGIAGAIGLVVAPLVWATNAFRARAALHESPGTDVANTYPTGSS